MVVPFDVPLIMMDTPGSGSPLSSVTVPVTLTSAFLNSLEISGGVVEGNAKALCAAVANNKA
ncbi:hypothetical protein D3C80_883770 [compost metagenome]